MSEKSICVEVELRIERQDSAGARDDQRVDLCKHSIGLGDAAFRNADPARNLVGFRVGQTLGGIDEYLLDLLGRPGGDDLDLHPALRARHEDDALRRAVDHHADIELFPYVRAFLDQQPPHLLAARSRLMRDELHAENLAGQLAHFVDGLGDLRSEERRVGKECRSWWWRDSCSEKW